MIGTLKKIEITTDLIEKVAKELFARCNDEDFNDQTEYVKGMWLNGACDMLEDFNILMEIFKKIGFEIGSDGRRRVL